MKPLWVDKKKKKKIFLARINQRDVDEQIEETTR